MAMDTEYPIFISYSRKDSKWVKLLSDYLTHQEIPPWIDNQLKYGEVWGHVIVERIHHCKVFVLMVSRYSDESRIVKKELHLALSENKVVMPVRIDDCIFEGLEAKKSIKLFDTIHPKSIFVEQLRKFAAPGVVPSSTLVKKRIEDFSLRLFKDILKMDKGSVHIGFGLNVYYGISLEQSLQHLNSDEWQKVFARLMDNVSHVDFGYRSGLDYSSLFPKISDFVNFLEGKVKWKDIQYL